MSQQRKSQSRTIDSACTTSSSYPTLSHTVVSTLQVGTVGGRAELFIGMENSCLTFATPSVIAGDRSAVDVCAHEISHVRLRFSILVGVSNLLIIHSPGSETVSDALPGVISGSTRVGLLISRDFLSEKQRARLLVNCTSPSSCHLLTVVAMLIEQVLLDRPKRSSRGFETIPRIGRDEIPTSCHGVQAPRGEFSLIVIPYE